MNQRMAEVLHEALSRPLTREEALVLLEGVRSWEDALELFRVAATVRDREVGRTIRLMGFIASITSCTTDPCCQYCWRWASARAFSDWDVLSEKQLALAARAIEDLGIRRVELGGGTVRGEEGGPLTLRAAQAVTGTCRMGVWINNGPSFGIQHVHELKQVGVEGIACNLESISEKVYEVARPGDSLARRKEIVEESDRAGLLIDNTLMIGLGEAWEDKHPYEEWVDFLFWFKRFSGLKILEIHPFRPVPGSPMEGFPAGSAFETAKARAVARLVFRNIDISGADEPLGVMSGANVVMHAVAVTKKERLRPGVACGPAKVRDIGDGLALSDSLPALQRYVEDLGFILEE